MYEILLGYRRCNDMIFVVVDSGFEIVESGIVRGDEGLLEIRDIYSGEKVLSRGTSKALTIGP